MKRKLLLFGIVMLLFASFASALNLGWYEGLSDNSADYWHFDSNGWSYSANTNINYQSNESVGDWIVFYENYKFTGSGADDPGLRELSANNTQNGANGIQCLSNDWRYNGVSSGQVCSINTNYNVSLEYDLTANTAQLWVDNVNILNGTIATDVAGVFVRCIGITCETTGHYAWQIGIVPAGQNFTITAIDSYNNSYSLFNLSAEIEGVGNFSTLDGTINTTLLNNDTTAFYNITISSNDSGGYFNRTYLNWNVSTNLQAELSQYLLYVTATDAVSGATISSFNLSSPLQNSTTGHLNLTVGTYSINVTASGYGDYELNITATALGNSTQAISMSPYVNFTILKETDNQPFNVENTTSTVLRIYCGTDTEEYNFNETANENSILIPVSCAWNLLRLEMTYTSSSYYRTLVPELTDRQINFYGIDLTEDLAYQINLQLNDLTGEYDDGTVVVKKFIGGATRTVIEQTFDIENKAVLYLIQNGLYTISVKNSAGSERNLGDLIADAAGTKTITIPDIAFVPEGFLGDEISWYWDRSNTSFLKLWYNDSSSQMTSWLNFYVYNGSDTTQLLYTTSSTNISDATYTYLTSPNSSYYACFNASNSGVGVFGECVIYDNQAEIGQWAGWDADEQSDITNWVSMLIIVFVILIFTKIYITAGLGLATILMWAFMKWSWLDFGTPWINYTLLTLGAIITVITYFIQEGNTP